MAAARIETEAQAGRDRAFELAALSASGELGYRRLTVQEILDRAGFSRPRFYRSFANKEECYARAYAAAIEALQDELLAAGAAADDWLGGFRACLGQVAAFAAADPLLARGVFAEVHVAGGAAAAKRKEVFERLTRALDSARRETTKSRHSPPPITAAFILNVAESALLHGFRARDPERFRQAIPALTYLTASVYFGEAAGERELLR